MPLVKERKMLAEKPGKDQLFIKPTKKGNPQTVKEALAGMKGGEGRTGFLGNGNIVHKPDFLPEPENLDKEGAARKRAVQSLLAKVIIPNNLSSRSTPQQDKRSLVGKLSKMTLKELNRLLPESMESLTTGQLEQLISDPSVGIGEEQESEVQLLYQDVSP